jgi:hypothetical protein
MVTMPMRSPAGNATRHDDRHHFVVLGKFAQADNGLVGLATGVERYEPKLLAADPSRRIDFIDRQLRRNFAGARQCCERPCPRGQVADQQLLRLRRSAESRIHQRRRGKGEYKAPEFRLHKYSPLMR